MRLVSYLRNGVEGAGIVTQDGGALIPLPGADQRKEPMLELIQEGLMDRIQDLGQMMYADGQNRIPLDQVKLLAPIPHPRDFLCIGLNFQDHAAQVAKERGEVYQRNQYPAYFAKRTYECTLDQPLPYIEGYEDAYEGGAEIAVIIGKDALDIAPEEAEDYILGYAVHNDLCENKINMHYVQPMQAKSLDGFAPFGPWIVTKDEFEKGHDWNIRMYIAGKLYAEDTSAHMSFDISYMVSQLSTHMTLKAGTVIASGSPGEFYERYYPVAGEDFVCSVEGIGSIRQPLIKADKPTPYSDKTM